MSLMIEFLERRFSSNNGFRAGGTNTLLMPDIRAALQGLQVQYLYIPPGANQQGASLPFPGPTPQSRVRRISALSSRGARDHKFKVNSKTWRFVDEHFNTTVFRGQHKLRYPNLPLVNTTGTAKNTEVWILMELLHIAPNQALGSTVPPNDMKTM